MRTAAVLIAAVVLLGGLALALSGVLDFELSDASPDEEHHIDVGDLEPAQTTSWQDFQYGRVTATDGQVFEGRLRWGRTQEAFWNDHFNGAKNTNPWSEFAPEEALVEERPRKLFGVEIGTRSRKLDLTRPFVARFGDLSTIEVDGRDLRVKLKNGTTVALDRFDADDVADGIRIWDEKGDAIDLVDRAIRRVEFLANPTEGPAPARLHGTVFTEAGTFTGFIEWNRRSLLSSDALEGRRSEGPLHLHFDTVRSIEKRETVDASGGVLVTLVDGQTLELDGHPDVDANNRGIIITEPRFGRVTAPWTAFRLAEFFPAGSGPAYDDFEPGRELQGRVTVRTTGEQLSGRLVFDLDEGQTTDTLDFRAHDINYSVPFARVASIFIPEPNDEQATIEIALHEGLVLQADRSGDLSDQNGGMLIFESSAEPTYVRWSDVDRVDFDGPRSESDETAD